MATPLQLMRFESTREGLTEAKVEEIRERFGMSVKQYYAAIYEAAIDPVAVDRYPDACEWVRRYGPDAPTKTMEQAFRDVAALMAEIAEKTRGMSPRQLAERVWHPGGPPIEELEFRFEVRAAGGPRSDLDELTLSDVSEIAGVTLKRFRAMRAAGDAPRAWKGSYNRIKFYRVDVDAWMSGRRGG